MAMIRTRAAVGISTPMHLLCSVREPAAALYRAELAAERARIDGAAVTWRYTRRAPSSGGPVGRLDLEALQRATLPPSGRPTSYVCGPTGFVETASALLVANGHSPASIRAERFGPTGG
jgi:ferredoxin-NADP reductase